MRSLISIVIPLWNEEENIGILLTYWRFPLFMSAESYAPLLEPPAGRRT